MKLQPLGTGTGFTRNYYHSNFIINFRSKRLLVDAGTTLRYSLDCANVQPDSIDAIFITHFHHDHVGGLAELLMLCYWRFISGVHTPHLPTLIFRPSQQEEMNQLLSPILNNQGLNWTDYCIPHIIKDEMYIDEEYTLQIINTDHLHCNGLKSCGLKIADMDSEKNIILSGDIKKLDESPILAFIDRQTSAIIQDVSFNKNSVHATYEEVLNYYPQNMYKKLFGIHYEDNIDLTKSYKFKLLIQGETL